MHFVDEEPVFAFHPDNQVNRKLTMDGVKHGRFRVHGLGEHQPIACCARRPRVQCCSCQDTGWDCWLSLSTTID